jgi:hypothetical protein
VRKPLAHSAEASPISRGSAGGLLIRSDPFSVKPCSVDIAVRAALR